MTWTFFNNDTMKTYFASPSGINFTYWYNYSVTPDEICFTGAAPPDYVTSTVCYECELSDDYTELTSHQGTNVAIFTKKI